MEKYKNKSTLKLILTMGLPPILSMLIQSLYAIVDAWYVAKVSQEAFNAVSIVYPIQAIILSVSVGLGVALNGAIARNYGRKNQEKVEEFIILGIVLTIIHYLILIALAFIVIEPFIQYNTTLATQDMARSYISIISFFSMGILFQLTFEKILQGSGNMLVPTIAQIIGCILNIILDHIFVLVLGYGVVGAASATVISQITSALILTIYVIINKKYKINIKRLNFSKENLLEIYKVCIPSTLMLSLPSVLMMGLNVVLNSINEMYVNILNLFIKVQTFVYMPVFGLLQGIRPIISYFYGAKQPNKIKEVLKLAIIIITGIMLVGLTIFMIMPDVLIKIFFNEQEILYHGSKAFRILSLCFVFAGVSFLFNTFYESLGFGVVSLVINLSRQFFITILLTILFVYVLDLGVIGVWYAMLLAEVVTVLLVGLMFRYTYNNTTIFLEVPDTDNLIANNGI